MKVHLQRAGGAYCHKMSPHMTLTASEVTCKLCQRMAIAEDYHKKDVWYTGPEVIRYIHSVIEDCALIVCPDPHIEEERPCYVVADTIRKLTDKWKDSEFVLRTSDEENVFKQRANLLQRWGKLSSCDMAQLKTLEEKIMNLRTARHPDDHEAMELIHRAASRLKNIEDEQ